MKTAFLTASCLLYASMSFGQTAGVVDSTIRNDSAHKKELTYLRSKESTIHYLDNYGFCNKCERYVSIDEKEDYFKKDREGKLSGDDHNRYRGVSEAIDYKEKPACSYYKSTKRAIKHFFRKSPPESNCTGHDNHMANNYKKRYLMIENKYLKPE